MDKTYCESDKKGYIGIYFEVFISSSSQLPDFPNARGTPIGAGGASP